jgi:hypothetical protein
MRTLLALSLLPMALLLEGCPLGCDAYDGAGDTTFRRGNDAMIVCSNGGYAATLSTATGGLAAGILEGRTAALSNAEGGALRGSIGDTGTLAFTLTERADGSWASPELGDGWTIETLDQTDLDHAHLQCTDLEARPWWTQSALALPVETAFARPAPAFPTVAACEDAQGRGEYPLEASCESFLVLCTDGTLRSRGGETPASGSYVTDLGSITASFSSNAAGFLGTYRADGTLSTGDTDGDGNPEVWQAVPASQVDAAVRCAR